MGGWDQAGLAGTAAPRSTETADPAAPGLKKTNTPVFNKRNITTD